MNLFLKTLAIFLSGVLLLTSPSSILAQTQQQPTLRFVIYYEGDFEQMLKKDSRLMSFIEAYDLQIVNTFEIDKDHKGFTIEDRKGNIINPRDLAREMSMYEGVIAVEIVPQTTAFKFEV